MENRLKVAPSALREFCERHSIVRLALFGSVLTGTGRPDSDVDLLVEFAPHAIPGLIALAGIEMELSTLLGGRRVDLRTAQDLSPHFREDVLRKSRGAVCSLKIGSASNT